MQQPKRILRYEGTAFERYEWRLPDGTRHREDGPAVEFANGYKLWWVYGKRHRLDGPAVEWANGRKSWWIEGKFYNIGPTPNKEWLMKKNEICNETT